MTNTTKPIRFNLDGTPRAAWGSKTRSTKPRKTKAGLGKKFPRKISCVPITVIQEEYLLKRAALENKTPQDIVRYFIDQAILSSTN